PNRFRALKRATHRRSSGLGGGSSCAARVARSTAACPTIRIPVAVTVSCCCERLRIQQSTPADPTVLRRVAGRIVFPYPTRSSPHRQHTIERAAWRPTRSTGPPGARQTRAATRPVVGRGSCPLAHFRHLPRTTRHGTKERHRGNRDNA